MPSLSHTLTLILVLVSFYSFFFTLFLSLRLYPILKTKAKNIRRAFREDPLMKWLAAFMMQSMDEAVRATH